MKKHLIFAALICAGCASQAANQEKARTLALFALLEDGHKVTEASNISGRAVLDLSLEGKESPATVVVVAYTDGGSDSPAELSPQVIPLSPGEEHLIRYQVDPKMKDGRLFVAVLPQGSPADKEVTALIEDWKKSPQSGARKVVQDRLSDWMEHQDQALKHMGQLPANVGGVRLVSAQAGNPAARGNLREDSSLDARGNPAPGARMEQEKSLRWQEVADSVGTSSGQPGVFSYPIRFPKR